MWANTYDARGGEPVWWHGRKAARRFADRGVDEGGPADMSARRRHAAVRRRRSARPADRRLGLGVVHRWTAEAGRLDPAGHRAPDAELAPDQLAAVDHRVGPGPGDRPGRVGQDPGADRAAAPPGGRPRGRTRGR